MNIVKYFERLEKRTKKGLVTWVPCKEPNGLQSQIGSFILTLYEKGDIPNVHPVLEIHNNGGLKEIVGFHKGYPGICSLYRTAKESIETNSR